MEDLVFLLATVAFFALAAAYVRFCETVLGDDLDHDDEVAR